MRRQLSQPSFTNGFARSPGESVRPDLWPDHAWVPALGCQGGVLYDLCAPSHGTITGATWTSQGLYFGNAKTDKVECGTPVDFSILTQFTFLITYEVPSAVEIVATNGSAYNLNSFLVTHNETSGRARFSTSPVVSTRYTYTESASIYSDGETICLSGVWIAGSSNRLFINGAPDSGAVVGSYYDTVGNGNGQWTLGKRAGTSTAYSFTRRLYNNLFWARALSDVALCDVTSDPLLPFRRRQIQKYWVPSTGGTTFNAAWARNSNVIIQPGV